MIDTQSIRTKILDLALHGQLTNRRVEDGTAADLFQRIQSEKHGLIQARKIKKEKALPAIDTVPYEIPEEWIWVRWGELSFQIQYGYNAPAQSTGRIRMVRITDIQNNKVIWNTVPYCDIAKEIIDEYRLQPNNILFARTGGTVGKSFLVENVEEEAVFAGYLIRTSFSSNLSAKYMKYFMESHLYWKQLQDGTTATAQPNCNAKTLSKMIVPLPPLAEQKRIVEKIEQAFSVLDTIDELQAQYADNLTALKSKLIDLAIQGKLTEQLPEDGTAEELYQQIQTDKQALIKAGKIKKEKTLSEITEDEIPFEVPENWKWVRLGEFGSWHAGATPSRGNSAYYNGSIPWLKTGDLNDGYITSVPEYITELALKECSVQLNPIGSVLIAMYGATIGKLGIAKIPLTTNQACCACIPYNGIYNRFLFFLLMSMRKTFIGMGIGGAQSNISREKIVNAVVPLPPLAEQKRIVKKLNEVLKMLQ